MIKNLFIASLFFIGVNMNAQNLVLNPSFETTTGGCVGFTGGLNNWDDANSGADSCESPDLFATCFPNGLPTSVPNNWLGSQTPRTGNRYAGIIAYAPGAAFNCSAFGSDQYREYIEGQLSAPLVAGQQYCVSFYVNLAGKVNWGVNKMGVYFSNTLLQHNFCGSPGVMPVTPQLQYSGSALMDTTNWVLLSWTYTAAGGEQYLTIGNFTNNAGTTHVNNNCSQINPYAYYFIDDVSVISGICQSCALSGTISNQVNVSCNGGNNGSATVSVTGGSGSTTYQWLPSGGSGATASGLSAGTYTVNLVDGSCTDTKTVTITQPNAIAISFPTNIPASCGQTNGSVTASATGGSGGITYTWNTGANGATLSNVAGGPYTVTATDANACTKTATVTVSSTTGPTVSSTVTQSVTCSGGSNGSASVSISGGTPGYTVNWSNAATGTSISGVQSGIYTYTVTDATNCVVTNSVSIGHAPDIIMNANTACVNSQGSATVTVNGGTPGYTYSWSSGQNTSTISGVPPGAYTVTVTDANNCVQALTMNLCNGTGISQVYVTNELLTLYPNPANETLTLELLANLPQTNYEIRVLDLLGKEVKNKNMEVQNGIMQLEIADLSAGVYFLNIKTSAGTVIKKFIIQR